jgi:hypothetical protein
MDMASFNELHEMVIPLIKKRDTLMRNSISPAERLVLHRNILNIPKFPEHVCLTLPV